MQTRLKGKVPPSIKNYTRNHWATRFVCERIFRIVWSGNRSGDPSRRYLSFKHGLQEFLEYKGQVQRSQLRKNNKNYQKMRVYLEEPFIYQVQRARDCSKLQCTQGYAFRLLICWQSFHVGCILTVSGSSGKRSHEFGVLANAQSPKTF